MTSQRKDIPEFGDADDAARFWDEHSPLDFTDDLKVVSVDYQPKREVLSVRFDPTDAVEISREARRLGMDKSTFVRYLVKSYLRSKSNRLEDAATLER